MEQPPSDFKGSPPRGFKLAPIQHLRDLESGSYWPQLRPYFQRPEFHRIRYTILGQTAQADVGTGPVSLRGASKAGELDVAFVADRLAAKMLIAGPGLPDYCLTMVGQGNLVYSGEGCSSASVDPTCGLVYQGNPGTTLASVGSQERLAIWIPGESVAQRLAALMGAPARGEVRFQPVFDWLAPKSAGLRQLIKLFMSELQSPAPSVLGSEAANRSFSDLLIYAMLRALPNNYSDEIARPRALATPGTLRRAEAYMRALVEEPIALLEVAQAAGCSV
ncbi:hypothetical protein, partial [Pseudotabrizicola sp.]|uniref:AraC-like ligand-binding domain-containing protein n=1 Tax=Pseudotabrizicola sp. TaxID=2939647 RepID=UPI00351CD6BB